ncbi:MAG TPA: FliH/SctL family protein [Magnetospirillaceae bacterium]|jgi:flagellar assembly protein FliH
MAAAPLKKYMFDLDFGSAAPLAAEELADTPIPTEDEIEVDAPPPPSFSEFDMEEARRVAHAEGHEAGVAEAGEVTARRQAEALSALAAGFAKVELAQQQGIESVRRDAVQLAVSIVKKLQPAMAHRYGIDEIGGVIHECMMQIDEAQRLTVRAHPDLIEGVRTEAARVAEEAEFEGKIVYTADPKLALGDCRVEWGNGGGDRDQALLWSEIETVIARAIEGMRNAPGIAPAAS